MENINDLFEKFKVKFEAVGGEIYRVTKAEEVGNILIDVLGNKSAKTVSLNESAISNSANLLEKLTSAGFEVHTDNLFHNTQSDDVGITEVNWGIAELGSLVQIAPEVDTRLCSTLVPIHIALLKTTSILPELDDVLDRLGKLPQIPGFVGFVTGPSRSSDIERILEIGVHGPKQVVAIMVDE